MQLKQKDGVCIFFFSTHFSHREACCVMPIQFVALSKCQWLEWCVGSTGNYYLEHLPLMGPAPISCSQPGSRPTGRERQDRVRSNPMPDQRIFQIPFREKAFNKGYFKVYSIFSFQVGFLLWQYPLTCIPSKRSPMTEVHVTHEAFFFRETFAWEHNNLMSQKGKAENLYMPGTGTTVPGLSNHWLGWVWDI